MKQDNDTLKQSDAGITGGTNGALGGAGKADLENGYIKDTPAVQDNPFGLGLFRPEKEGGFVGRPEGWER